MAYPALHLAAAMAALSVPALSQPTHLPPSGLAVPLSNGAEANTGSANIRVTALTDSILRVCVRPAIRDQRRASDLVINRF